MDMDQAAVFLAGSILTVIGIVVIIGGILVVNNLLHKYWKPLNWNIWPSYFNHEPPRFIEPHEVKEEPKK